MRVRGRAIWNGGGVLIPKPNGSPSSLTLTVVSDTQINLSWTNGSTNEDGISIERSTDNITYTVIHTTASGVSTYSNTGLTENTTYYYKVRAVKGSKYSSYSNVINSFTYPLLSKFLFLGYYSQISGGHMPNILDNGITYLTVSGSVGSETYQCPNIADYIAADTDFCWFDSFGEIKTQTTENLVGYDISRTPVKYDYSIPYQIRIIAILKSDSVLSVSERNALFSTFQLPVLWDNQLNNYGSVKGNRTTYTPFSTTDSLAPSDVISTTITDTRIDLSCTSHSTTEDGFKWEKSTDNITFTEMGTSAAGVTTYSATGLSANTKYYFRCRAYMGTKNTAYSLSINDYTAMRIPLAASGNGTGVATLNLQASANITMSIDGNGKFYDDAGGTTNEGTIRTITSGALRTFYLKVSSGSCSVYIYSKNNLTQWGDAINQAHTAGWIASTNAPSINMDVSALSPSLIKVYISGNNTMSGSLAQFSSNITHILFAGNANISGALSTMPRQITYVLLFGACTVTGDFADLPSGITYIALRGNTTVANYTPGHTFNNNVNLFESRPTTGNGLDSTEVDNLFIDLANATWAGSNKTFYIAGNNAARTAASDTADITLTNKGIIITHN